MTWGYRPLGADYAKPPQWATAGEPAVDRLLQMAGLLHDCGQLHLEGQRVELARQAQALERLLADFKQSLAFAHILPCEDWADARRGAWVEFVTELRHAGLSQFVVAGAHALDGQVRP
jgi:hypothetical protein